MMQHRSKYENDPPLQSRTQYAPIACALCHFSPILLATVMLSCVVISPTLAASPDQRVIVVVGAAGTPEYGTQFEEWAEQWRMASSHTEFSFIGPSSQSDTTAEGTLEERSADNDPEQASDRDQLQKQLAELVDQPGMSELWLVLIGHGTFDGRRAKFNLRGKDLLATELAEWIQPLNQRIIVINGASCSGPFVNEISGPNRIVVASTRSGFEYNFSRFGSFMATAISDLANDLDKDGQTSVLEAFCSASQSVAAVYQQDNRLATEHSLIDDNGDERGTPADWFDGVRVTRQPKEGIADGLAANQVCLERRGVAAEFTPEQREKRDALETQLERLRSRKASLDEALYLSKIEPILVDLARMYADAGNPAP